MILNYSNFYRHYGVRQVSQIAEPALVDLKLLELPSLSVYHYVSYDGTENGPASSDYLFRHITHPILLGHVSELVETKGAPRVSSSELAQLITDYHRLNRRMRRIKGVDSVERDTTSLVVYNYCLINKVYRYARSMFTEYFKWYNLFATVAQNIADVAARVERQHFIFAKIPKVIPSVEQLAHASEELTAAMLNTFRGEDSFFLLELWKWLGVNRADSLFARIPANKIHLVNIVYQEGSRWTVVNLGKLNTFRQAKDDPDIKNYVLRPESQPLDPLQIQKRVLRMMMTLMEVRTLTANVAVPEEPAEVPVPQSSSLAAKLSDEEGDDENAEDVSLIKDEGEDTFEELDAPSMPTLIDGDVRDMDIGQNAQAGTDEEVDEETKKNRIREEDERLDEDLLQLNEIAKRQEEQAVSAEAPLQEVIYQAPEDDLEQGVLSVCDRLADDGLLSAAEYKRFSKLASMYKTLPAPEGKGFLGDFVTIPPETLQITQTSKVPDSMAVLDKSMLGSSLLAFDERYITDVMAKDTAGMVLNIQKAGVAVTGYTVEKVHDILGGYEMHRVRLTPVVGQQSTLHFKLPLLNPNGTYSSNGVKYSLRKQRGDLPIRKTAPARVALTSYYGKGFVNRGRKKANDYGHWLQCQVMVKALDKEDMSITALVADNVFRPREKAPRALSAIACAVKSLQARGFTLFFDLDDVAENFEPAAIKTWAVRGNKLIGKNPAGDYLVIDPHGTVYTAHQKSLTPFGSLESFLNIPIQNAPVESASLVVFGKEIPIGVILAYYLGFEKLLRLLKVTPRRVPAGARLNLQGHEYALAFSDESLVFSRDDRFAAMVLGGFNDYHRAIKLFSVYSFDKRGVYLNLLEANGLGTRFVREIDLMRSMFVDPITKDLLVEMKEPTTFQGLLLRSCELLLSDTTPEELDPAYMRIKGYERMSGAVYTEIIQSLRAHNSRLGKSNAPIEMNPYAVWKRISEDPAKSQVSEINPIKSIKEVEAVTYAGTGGRNKQSMTKSSRIYHPNDMGTISESTTDSSDVGINIFMCADPQFTSLRGISKRYDMENKPTASLLSTSALLAPGSDRDDPKRVNFIAIQQEHAIGCEGYHQATVRTGYDSVVAHRSHDLFAYTAKKPGVVKSLQPKGIIIEHDDGTLLGLELGRRFGNAAGLTVPHNIITPMKAGERFEVGGVICYNDGFFEPDFFNPKEIVWKNAMNVTTVLWEGTETHEDASSISKRVEERLTTKVTKLKTLVVDFTQTLSRLVKVGERVEADTILCIIEDAVTADNKLFDEKSLDTLRALDAQTPKAHVKGVIERIEVFYHGDKDYMSESLRAIADESDRMLKRNATALGQPAFTGAVDGGFRIDNNQLGPDSMAIRIYITSSVASGVGDKGVFCNQMKTVFSRVREDDMTTENGEKIDAVFGQKSIDARIVSSPAIIGTSNVLLKLIAKKAVAIYRAQAA